MKAPSRARHPTWPNYVDLYGASNIDQAFKLLWLSQRPIWDSRGSDGTDRVEPPLAAMEATDSIPPSKFIISAGDEWSYIQKENQRNIMQNQ